MRKKSTAQNQQNRILHHRISPKKCEDCIRNPLNLDFEKPDFDKIDWNKRIGYRTILPFRREWI
jgi:hypothetical protein